MTTKNIPQTEISRKTSRRQFLAGLRNLALAAIPAALLPTITQPTTESDLPDSLPAPYGPAERTAIINRWERRFDNTIVHLERYWAFLSEAKSQAPESIDLYHMMSLETAAREAMESILEQMERTDFDTLSQSVTGRNPTVAFIAWEIRNEDKTDPEAARRFWLKEIECHPDNYKELRAILDEVYPAQDTRS